MSDPTQASNQATPTVGSSPDPLAALEELLQSSKADDPTSHPSAASAETKQAELDSAAEEEKKKAIQLMEEKQKAIDASDLLTQISDLKSIDSTPQEQARLAQKEQLADDQQTQKDNQGVYQIHQLGHTKI
ncbi:MAG: hypothetical protein COU63_04520 [Candidatus Pacebacteria bacterium CG10_big_fil_rev_8_21_14_0_10_36_11]|nr:hypothetical protein [Candidatus Pacearchaeota archaeon]OIP74026.1 MAG: hypothetical protein AUK08_02095 [Candidatus Pacebacteria bacterium CG2_30_36_39]PIR64333.1 MAG: hypothetical protein COU63_04520 [Candidatus Pacebacteria bacterium CG10_big_fil_rev_8_21_14_0_10_36_11]PJC42540.1 MAG: hypothetical protein CO040_03890 [Candidatus Pacebacteria bacterium CG_4_9_14_0_2_um_filter_36_8]